MKIRNIFQKLSKISEIVAKIKNLPDKILKKFRRVKGGKTRNNLNKVSVPLKVSLTLFLSILLAVGVLPTNPVSGSELDEINNQIQDLENSVSQKKQQAKTLQNEIAIIDEQVQQIELQIQATQMELAQVEAEIADLNVRIEEAIKELERQKDILAEHLQILYEEGQTSTLEIVASSENFSEFVNRSEYLENMQDKVRETVDKIKALKDELNKKKAELTAKQNRLVELKKQQDAQKQGLVSQKGLKDSLLSTTEGEEQVFQKKLNDLYATKAALSAQFNESVSTGSSNYPYGNPPPSNIIDTPDAYGYLIGECTSYAAWKRASVGNPVPRNLGNANTWGIYAAGQGYTVNSTPTVGSVMVFPSLGFYGHVAIVETVYSNGNVVISEYNWVPYSYTIRGNDPSKPVNPTNWNAVFIH